MVNISQFYLTYKNIVLG